VVKVALVVSIQTDIRRRNCAFGATSNPDSMLRMLLISRSARIRVTTGFASCLTLNFVGQS
jgi:hypothetical protein